MKYRKQYCHFLNTPSNHNYLYVFTIVISCSIVLWIVSLYFNPTGKQLNVFFQRTGNFFADATNTTGLVSELDPYHNDTIGLWNAAYPPLAYAFFYFFAHVSEIPTESYLFYIYQPVWLLLFLLAMVICISILWLVIIKQLNEYTGILAYLAGFSICFSLPMLFTIERGNIIILATLSICVFIFYYDSPSKFLKEAAIICLAFASGLKITPALFGILLLYNKDWRAILRTIVYGCLFVFPPFLLFKGGLTNISQLINNIHMHLKAYTASEGTGLISSYVHLYELITGKACLFDYYTYNVIVTTGIVSAVVLLIGGFFMKEKWQQVLCVTISLLILPSVSGEYCLLYLIPFTILFLKQKTPDYNTIENMILLLCLIMVFFLYRCRISDALNYHIAVPLMMITALIRAFKEFFLASKRILGM